MIFKDKNILWDKPNSALIEMLNLAQNALIKAEKRFC